MAQEDAIAVYIDEMTKTDGPEPASESLVQQKEFVPPKVSEQYLEMAQKVQEDSSQ